MLSISANLLLVAAIEIAGLAVAFPVGIGLALVIGVLLNYILAPQGNPLLLFGGLVFVVLAIVVDAMAYQRRELVRKAVGKKGVQISLVAGVLMGLFYPFVAKAGSGPSSLRPYSVTFCFALGVLICAIPSNLYLMRKPLTDESAVPMNQYVGSGGWIHLVHGCDAQLCGIECAPGRTGSFLRDRSGRNVDLSYLGSFCVEGV